MISTATSTPYSQNPASHEDLPWITRAVDSQVTIPLDKFLKTLLPEYEVSPKDCDVRVEEIIRDCSGPDLKKSFTRLFSTITGSLARCGVDGGLPGSSSVIDLRVPDCALVEIDLEGKNTVFNGTYYAKEGLFKSVWHLLAKRASDAMSTGIPRSHIYGVYVKREYACFAYYDHSAVIVSEPMNWVKEAHSFWKAIYTVSKLGLDRIGCAATFFTFPDLGLRINGLDLKLINVVQASEHIIGECTSMIHARILTKGPWKDQVVTVKFSFVPKGKGWKDEESVVSKLRKKLSDVAVLLPVVITSETLSLSQVGGEVRKPLGTAYQARELRVTVYAGQLYPVTNLANDLEILQVFEDVMLVLREMYCLKQSLSHRSLSPCNILYRKIGNQMRGVLTGFELCAQSDDVANGSAPSCLDAFESSPFLSPDILNKQELCIQVPLDCHRYDLESIYNILFFIATHYENGKRISGLKPPFDVWFGNDDALSASSKAKHVRTEEPNFKSTRNFGRLANRLRKLHVKIRCGYIMRDYSPGFDEDSILLWVTYADFCNMLFEDNNL